MPGELAAQAAIGAFYCEFSALDHELGETLKVVYRLTSHEAADAIIAALGDFARKAGLVSEAVGVAKKADGSETSSDWKEKSRKTMKRILGINRPDRVLMAHSLLKPNSDGSVQFINLQNAGAKPSSWTQAEFQRKISEMGSLLIQLRQIKEELSTLTISVPNLGFISMGINQPSVARNALLFGKS
jgi:hypothetical protein